MSRARSTSFLIIVGLLLFIAVVAVVGSSPTACRLCHAKPVDAMQSSKHGSVGCYQCHLGSGVWSMVDQKANEIFHMYPLALIGRRPSGPVKETSRNRCLSCHKDVLTKASVANDLRIVHLTCAHENSCDPCHVETAHPGAVRWTTGPSMEKCTGCHNKKQVAAECNACHVGEMTSDLDVRGPWQVTHGPNWKQTHGMGDLDSCQTCHPAGFCTECHGLDVPHTADFGEQHGKLAQQNPDSCETCHEQSLCDGCHLFPMPHSAEFTVNHRKIAKTTLDVRCYRCHVRTDCGDCHSNHVHPGGSTGVPVPWYTTDESMRPKESD